MSYTIKVVGIHNKSEKQEIVRWLKKAADVTIFEALATYRMLLASGEYRLDYVGPSFSTDIPKGIKIIANEIRSPAELASIRRQNIQARFNDMVERGSKGDYGAARIACQMIQQHYFLTHVCASAGF